jgi:hypothetical protein
MNEPSDFFSEKKKKKISFEKKTRESTKNTNKIETFA